tara:strand:+ start:139 stop:1551 length:1413 start_codon:yes stop_codon:yes gene_type:complete
MLGKFFGSEFGKGLVAGAAEGFADQFQDDINRTKDNVDRLVLESYKGGVAQKKKYDALFEDNKKIVEQIAGNLGGDDGINHPMALEAAYGLINTAGGLKNALEESVNAKAFFNNYGMHPIKQLELSVVKDRETPLTVSNITKTTVPKMVIPDPKLLGDSAAVGIMKADFLGDFDASKEISKRSAALLTARGIDINEGEMKIPTASKVRLDPLIRGMQTDPIAEIARLQVFGNKLDPKAPDFVQKFNRVKDMINVQVEVATNIAETRAGILDKSKIGKGLSITGLGSAKNQITNQIIESFNVVAKKDNLGLYMTQDLVSDKQDIIQKTRMYYLKMLNLGVTNKDDQSFYKVMEAIANNKQLSLTDGKLEVLSGEGTDKISTADKDTLKKGSQKIPDPFKINKGEPVDYSKIDQNALISSIRKQGINTINGKSLLNTLKGKINFDNPPELEGLTGKARVNKIEELAQELVKR